jgi:hypothetical protein
MPTIAGLKLETPQDQLAVMVLKALDELGAESTRGDTIRLIANRQWFALIPEDRHRYPSDVQRGLHEPRWHIALAFARSRAVELKYVGNSEWNCWQLDRLGREALRQIESRFSDGTIQSGVCFMWSPVFKRLMDSNYVEGSDLKRPGSVYQDMPGFLHGSIRHRQQIIRWAEED